MGRMSDLLRSVRDRTTRSAAGRRGRRWCSRSRRCGGRRAGSSGRRSRPCNRSSGVLRAPSDRALGGVSDVPGRIHGRGHGVPLSDEPDPHPEVAEDEVDFDTHSVADTLFDTVEGKDDDPVKVPVARRFVDHIRFDLRPLTYKTHEGGLMLRYDPIRGIYVPDGEDAVNEWIAR